MGVSLGKAWGIKVTWYEEEVFVGGVVGYFKGGMEVVGVLFGCAINVQDKRERGGV